MCRLFAQISPSLANARHWLAGSEFSIFRQSDFDKGNLQKDGWGIAHFGNKGRPLVSKSPMPVYKEKESFLEAAGKTSRVVIGHIRAASNPLGIPRNRLINLESTQPFTDGRWIFAHNGTLEIPREVAGRLGPLRHRVKSPNDSEVYFWQFVKFFRKTRDAVKALKACVQEDWELWSRCRERYPDKKGPYTSLNAVLSDGRRLYAFCHAVRRGMAAHGVCNPDQPWSVMSFARRKGCLIVASENLDRKAWTRLVPPEILCAEIASGRLRLERKRLALEGVPAPQARGPAR